MEFFCNFFSIFLFLLWNTAESRVVPKKLSTDTLFTLELKMPNVLPQKDDDYFCTGIDLKEQEIYVKKFDPNADAGKIHHMIIFGCKSVIRSHLYPNHWSCSHAQLCPGMRIIYAWGKNAPSLQLPPDVGFHLGPQSDINYLVLQAHYAHPLSDPDSSGVRLLYTLQPQPYVAGIFLLASYDGLIPANNPKSHVDMNCKLDRDPITVFAYRVHAHALGVVVTGYRFSPRKKQWDLIAKGNPQWPQAFYPMEQPMRIESDDIIYARCTYNSTKKSSLTVMGSRSSDEMCNLYLMYYADNPLFSKNFALDSIGGGLNSAVKESCEDMEFESHVLPEGNDIPPPRNVTMEESAIGQHSIHNHQNHGMNHGGAEASSLMVDLKVDSEWPFGDGIFGQITAIDVDQNDNIVIFHRGKHVWNDLSFDLDNHYRPVRDGPIDEPTIVTIDPKTRKIIDKWGQNLFFLPHGLTIDRKNMTIWLTDVALHQIFKYSIDPADKRNFQKSLLTLGERFVPGKDEKHFCKPTSVALDNSNGDFYVADGYCNSRIIRFDSNGKFLNHWGHEPIIGLNPTPNSLNVPHKVLFIERPDGQNLVCVADRENGRIECFLAPFGQFQFQIKLSQFNGRVFSITYSKRDDVLYAVSGKSLSDPTQNVMAFAFDFSAIRPIATFAPADSGTFSQPHDMAVSANGDSVYVVEIGPNNIWKFTKSDQSESADNSAIPKELARSTEPETSAESLKLRKAKILDPNLNSHQSPSSNETINNFSFDLLRIRTKEFREKVWSNELFYFILLGIFLFIIFLNMPCTANSGGSGNNSGSTIRFCLSILSLLKYKIDQSTHKNGKQRRSRSSERIRLSDVLRKNKQRKIDRWQGFNRLPQDESEHDDLVHDSDDEDDDDNDSVVLGDFTTNKNKHHGSLSNESHGTKNSVNHVIS